jgi:hypothetical protein
MAFMYLRLVVSILVSILVAASVIAGGTQGRLVEVNGEVWLQAPGAEEARARVGEVLVSGTKIRTGVDGQAEVAFEDGSFLVVQNNSSLLLSGIKRHRRKKTSILIFFGRIWNKLSRKIGEQASYEVNTPIVVCGVRGTDFEAAVGDDGSVRIRVAEGAVGVIGDGEDKVVNSGQELEGDFDGISDVFAAEEKADWAQWQQRKRERLRQEGRNIVDKVKDRILTRKMKVEELRINQKTLEDKRRDAIERARAGDSSAIEEIRGYNQELVVIANEIADLGDAAGSQFGLIDHFADLATDLSFRMIDGKYVEAEAVSMKRIKAMFDKMIAEGTDISLEAMEKMLQEMSEGQRGGLKFPKGSAADDLFGRDENDIQP